MALASIEPSAATAIRFRSSIVFVVFFFASGTRKRRARVLRYCPPPLYYISLEFLLAGWRPIQRQRNRHFDPLSLSLSRPDLHIWFLCFVSFFFNSTTAARNFEFLFLFIFCLQGKQPTAVARSVSALGIEIRLPFVFCFVSCAPVCASLSSTFPVGVSLLFFVCLFFSLTKSSSNERVTRSAENDDAGGMFFFLFFFCFSFFF